jgi:hypothetical protein
MDDRLSRLSERHVRQLTQLIDAMQSPPVRNVPNIDPNDGGTSARALFFLETPGPQAINGYVSRDNCDPTAKNFLEACSEAGLDRKQTALWNVFPFCLPAGRLNPKTSEILSCISHTQAFINAFHELDVVVFCGNSAKRAMPRLNCGKAIVLDTFHTGAQSYGVLYQRAHIEMTFHFAAAILNQRKPNQATP